MKIVEGTLKSRDGNLQNCEDAVVVTDDFACVMDGTTSKSEAVWQEKTSGQMASILISDAVTSLSRNVTREEAINALTSRIADYYRSNKLYDELKKEPIRRFTASVALYSDCRKEIWIIGDVQAKVGQETFGSRIVLEEILANARALFLEMELIRGKTIDELMQVDTGREFIKPLLKGQSLFQNSDPHNPYSYGVIDGFPVPEPAIKTIRIEKGTEYLILATDGYPFLEPTLEQSERRLEEVLTSDPLCMREYKATKGLKKGTISYDDRAYLKLIP